MGGAGVEPAASSVIREVLYHLSYPPSGRGWARTSSLLFVRQALSRLSYSPVRQIRDKGSNLDLHVQSVVSCRLDDPGTDGRPPSRAPAGQSRNATCRIARAPCSVFITTRCQPCRATVA